MLQLGDERHQVISDNRPKDIQIDGEIAVDEPIPRPSNLLPGKLRSSVFGCLRYMFRGFAEDFQESYKP